MLERRRKRKKQIIIIGSNSGVVLLLLMVYLGMAFYFKNHFIFRTEINGWKVGGMTVSQAEEKIGDHVEEYLKTSCLWKGYWMSVCTGWNSEKDIGKTKCIWMDYFYF